MITKEELERIKQGDGLVIESNGIKHYGASEAETDLCLKCGWGELL